MIKKQQKWIALFVVLTFMWLLRVSTMPLAAANTTEQVSSTNAEQGPGYVESVGYKAAPAKKSILPVILIGVGVIAVAAVLFLVVLKTKYDIQGTWTITYVWSDGSTGSSVNEFVGDKKTGDVKLVLGGNSAKWGEYTVDGKNVSFTIIIATYVGKFTDKTHMSGTISNTLNDHGTWTAEKTSSTTTAVSGDPQIAAGPLAHYKK